MPSQTSPSIDNSPMLSLQGLSPEQQEILKLLAQSYQNRHHIDTTPSWLCIVKQEPHERPFTSNYSHTSRRFTIQVMAHQPINPYAPKKQHVTFSSAFLMTHVSFDRPPATTDIPATDGILPGWQLHTIYWPQLRLTPRPGWALAYLGEVTPGIPGQPGIFGALLHFWLLISPQRERYYFTTDPMPRIQEDRPEYPWHDPAQDRLYLIFDEEDPCPAQPELLDHYLNQIADQAPTVTETTSYD